MNGIVFTQQGVPVQGSSDYQKVLDSRWRFMEVAYEDSISLSLPAASVDVSRPYYEKTIIMRHNLGFLPAFEVNCNVSVFADETTLFTRRLISGSVASQNITGSYRIFNLPVTEDYQAPSQVVSGASAPKTRFGIKFLDGSMPNVAVKDNLPVGFSADTTQKILSVHRTNLVTFVAATSQSVPHGMGYPPTYLMAPYNEDEITFSLGTKRYMGPLNRGIPLCYVKATNTDLIFSGIQSAFSGKYAIVILKDPAEIAQ